MTAFMENKLPTGADGGVAQVFTLGGQVATLATGAASAATTDPINEDRNQLVILWCDQDVHVTAGASPTADTDDLLLTANSQYPYSIPRGLRIAAIQASAAGTLRIVNAGEPANI
ncbi:MAG: hypothetical protein J4F41_00025 [Alphaproteobacteria bacterium]|nr:hypothetical protein [Alphaproteobacteria bacterium]